MGIALLAMSTLEVFSQPGIERALVQKKGDIKGYLDTAWVVLAARGIVISVLLIISAPLVATFFHSPNVVLIIQVVAISQLLNGLTNIGVVYFQKELEFKKQFIYQLSGTIADVVVAVSLAFILRNVWAIVYGLLAGSAVRIVMSYIVHPYRPGLNFDLKKAKELFEFGGWIFVSSILVFLLTQGDDALVGKVLGTTALGFYIMAYRLSNTPATEIAHMVSHVSFPAYSKLQDDLQRLKDAYLKVVKAVTFASIPLAGAIFILAPEFTKIFLGEKWMPMVPAMRVLCIFGAVRSIQNTFGALFNGIGKPEINTKLGATQLLIMIALIYPLTIKWGILGTALATVIPIFICLFLGMRELKNILEFKYNNFCNIIFLPLIATSTFCFALSMIRNFSWYKSNLIYFFTLLNLGIVLYFTIIYSVDKIFKYGLFNEISKLHKSFLKE
jgi:O-antigen/teichoic acid export membrane protein